MTVATGAAGATHTLQPGDVVTISGAANAGYNGTFTVHTVPGTRAFTYTNPISGLPGSGGGTITLAAPGLQRVGQHGHGQHGGGARPLRRRRGDHRGRGNAGYNGNVDDRRGADAAVSSQFTNPTAGLPNAGGGTMTFISPFNLRVGGNTTRPLINSAELHERRPDGGVRRDPGLRRHGDGHRHRHDGLHRDVHRRAADTDVSNFQIVRT